jgi:predicted AAA+ superfamily ATPase
MFEELVSRRVEAVLEDLLLDEPVIALHGPRSVGKSTVLRRVATAHGVSVVDLDDPVERDAVQANPSLAVSSPRPVCIDEYQHVPIVLDSLKARLNREGAVPGTAVLTGSTRHDALPRTAQALTGRLHSLTIWPLSQGEIEGVHENIVESLYQAPDAAVAAFPRSTTTREEYVQRMCAGGFPLALTRRSTTARDRWFDNYVRTSIERDAKELDQVRQRQLLADVLGQAIGRTAQVLNISAIAERLAVRRDGVENLFRLLEDLFLVFRLPAWGKTLTARSTSSPKIHAIDTGLAARLMRINPDKLSTLDPTVQTEFGHLTETFVVTELRKQISWMNASTTVGHWRTSDGAEVDFVIEKDDGSVVAFEVKAAERIAGKDFSGLRLLRERLGQRFIAGIALSMGPRSYTYEDRLHVMPIDRLWRA